MAAIRGRNTGPEIAVRRLLREFRVGYGLHVADLPGRPDIVMRGRKKAIEVRGCFWHRHTGCKFAYMPKSRHAFWRQKFAKTVMRDSVNERALRSLGYDLLVVWECETADTIVLRKRVAAFLGV
jgi:DNA mismatch endonuclease, patch repair protein